MFVYTTGEVIMKGDVVKTGNKCDGVVEEILKPHSPRAKDYGCEEEGGVVVIEDWAGIKSYLLVSPIGSAEWEHLSFVDRRKHKD